MCRWPQCGKPQGVWGTGPPGLPPQHLGGTHKEPGRGEIQKVFGTGSSARHGEFRRGFWYRDQLLTEAHTREGLSLALFGLGDFSKPAAVFRANYAGDRGFGHCYPPVLTERFYINGQLHFTNLETRKQASNPIARGACNTAREGYIPANGMIYTFPNHCACFPALEGNLCLAPPSRDRPEENHELVRGPAWPAQPTEADTSKDWPTFRHDEHRTGGTEVTVPAQLEVLWTARIEGPAPEDPLVADGLAYAAAGIHPNADGGVRVACIRPETGEMIWQREFDDLGFESPWPAPYEPRKTRPDSNPWRTIRPIEYRYFDLPVRDGATLAEMKLGVPAWDGLAAAGGKLYLSTEGGNVVCLGRR